MYIYIVLCADSRLLDTFRERNGGDSLKIAWRRRLLFQLSARNGTSLLQRTRSTIIQYVLNSRQSCLNTCHYMAHILCRKHTALTNTQSGSSVPQVVADARDRWRGAWILFLVFDSNSIEAQHANDTEATLGDNVERMPVIMRFTLCVLARIRHKRKMFECVRCVIQIHNRRAMTRRGARAHHQLTWLKLFQKINHLQWNLVRN